MRHYIYILLALVMVSLSSCSGDKYLNAIPKESTALLSIDMQEVTKHASEGQTAQLLQSMFQVQDVKDCGLDLSSKVYLFEASDGTLGLAVKVDDDDDLDDWLTRLSQKGICQKPQKRRGMYFTVLKQQWVVGFNSDAMLVMGPVLPASQPDAMRQIMQNLNADEGIKDTPMYDKLQEISSPIALVAQAQALPQQFIAPFTLGASADTDPKDVLIAASMTVSKGILRVDGNTFSFKPGVDKALQTARKAFKPLTTKYISHVPSTALFSLMMNVPGPELLKMMQQNKGLLALLAGVNQAIDLDNIIKSGKGDMAIAIPSFSDDNLQLAWASALATDNFLKDVPYWKQSVPKGGRITDAGPRRWRYSGGGTSFTFGVTNDLQFYLGNNDEQAQALLHPASKPLNGNVQAIMKGARICAVINLQGVDKGSKPVVQVVSGMLKPLFGDIHTLVYVQR